jgi:putative DNA primase/helicase
VYVDPQTGQRLDLREWDQYHGRRFELAKALQTRKPDVFIGKVSEHKHHLRCVNADAHTTAGEDHATFVMNASQSDKGWFVHHCRHGHCEGRHRLVALQQMLEAGWLSIGDLTDRGFLSEAAADEGASFDLTEHCVAVAFSRRSRERFRYCHTTGAWFIWTGTIWQRDYKKRALTQARRLTAELNRDEPLKTRAITGRYAFAAAVERYAQADPALAVTADVWNSDPWLLGTPGGVVDLRTGQLRPAERTDFITRSTAVAPAEVAHCPTWLQFLREATGGDDGLIRFLQQWFGYCLTGHTYEHALVFLYGPGGNGKGVLLGTIASVMRSYAATAALDTFTATRGERHPTDLAMLDGARLVQTNETEEDRAWAEARIKTLTGGDAVTARFMRQDFFTYIPQFKLVISGNHQPALRNVDDAARRRFNVVPFLHKPPIPDPLLSQKLRDEWPAILRWMIDGGLDWQGSGLVRPQAVLDATEQYFAEQDLFSQWLEEFCEARDGVGEKISELFASWRAFAQARFEEPHNAKWLSVMLERRGFVRAKDCELFRGRGFRGVQLTASMRGRHWAGGDG